MGKLVSLVIILATFWVGWWLLASAGLHREITRWFEARRVAGWQADLGSMEKQGFPLRLHAHLTGIAVADPFTGVTVGMDQLDIMAPAYWPGYASVILPQTPIRLATPLVRATLKAPQARADLRLRPGPSLQMQSVMLQSGVWGLKTSLGDQLSAEDMSFSMQQTRAGSPVYDIDANAGALKPGSALRTMLGLPADWPLELDVATADLRVTFDRVWDRSALAASRPQPQAIELTMVEVIWGDAMLRATGDLQVDAQGRASGALTVKAENWPAMLDMAENAGALPDGFRPQAEQILKALAQMTDQTTGLDVTINFTDGRMAMGFIPLGRAPLVRLR